MSFGLITLWAHFLCESAKLSYYILSKIIGQDSTRSSYVLNMGLSSAHKFRIAGLDKLSGDGLLETGEQPIYWQSGDRIDTAQAGVWA
jgi:hypothetical protein